MSQQTNEIQLPDIQLTTTGDQSINLRQLEGHYIVLYFYPKDATPGCTQEGRDFRDLYNEFAKLNTIILGVSRDSLNSHEKFKQKQEFPFDLISDTNETLCQTFDVIRSKKMFGKQVRGIERSTFLFDKQGNLQRQWRKVKVNGHAKQVLETIQELENH